MSDIAIQVENLSKRYRIGLREERHDLMFSAAMSWLRSPLSNYRRLRNLSRFDDNDDAEDVIWALNDLSFEVKRGEVIGVIGHNGAGKSTLLKILSRITEPSSGRAILHGRVASLLEVGTGFHPELTGRENIYLNGTILGMSKVEVGRKFEQIVDFSEIERFIDTPVKRYSSGMKVRLAFSVAAHLEPEVLLVDEVLAVGDISFRRKCLGKMEGIAETGSTILFVSHNMAAIRSLCQRAVLLDGGRRVSEGPVDEVVDHYISISMAPAEERVASHASFCRVDSVRIEGPSEGLIKTFGPATVSVTITATERIIDPGLYIAFLSVDQQRLAGLDFRDFTTLGPILEDERRRFVFRVDSLPFLPGSYLLEIYVKDIVGSKIERLERLFPFEIAETSVYGLRKIDHWNGHCALKVSVSAESVA